MSEAKFGGNLRLTSIVDRSTVKKKGSEWTAEQSGWAFNLWYVNFGFQGGHNHSHAKIDEDYKTSSRMMLSAFGGNAALVNTGEFQSWIDTVHLDLSCSMQSLPTRLSQILRRGQMWNRQFLITSRSPL